MATRGLRVCVAGATGALGSEVLSVLDGSQLRVGQLVPVAGEGSLGADIEFQGELAAVERELPALQGMDVLFSCAPRDVAREVTRAALRAEVPCIDVSGVFTLEEEVPLSLVSCGDRVAAAPLLAGPTDASLVWTPVLRALRECAPLREVTGSVLEGASASGRLGIEALSSGSLALFNQQEPPEELAGVRPLAFDCHPSSGPSDPEGRCVRELELALSLRRLLGSAVAVSARWIQLPVFVGQASCLWVELADAVSASAAAEQLDKAPGVALWSGDDDGPNLRAASGRSVVLAGRPQPDPANPRRLRLWLVGDVLRLAAVNAVALAAARLQLG